ncbi:MAG: hypothetical protein AAF607_06340 [Pseudomonadota bacterium]
MKPVLITTEHRGVFAGLIPEDQDLSAKAMPLKAAKMAIYWSGKKGLMSLCKVGPKSECRISAPADIPMLHDITAVFTITPEAWEAWKTK